MMVIINLNIDADIDKRFRDAVVAKFGMKRGNLKKGMEEALELWVANNKVE